MSKLRYLISHHQFKKYPFRTILRLVLWETYYKLFNVTALVPYYEDLRIELQPMKHRGISGLIYIFRKLEEQSSFMTDYIKEGMTVLDIGANIGYYSIIYSKLVGEKGRIYSFEPTKSTYDKLLKNIQINKCKNIIPLNYALSNVNEKRKFYHAEAHDRNAFAPEIENAEHEEVECKVLDEFIRDNNLHVDFLKIDVEGSELLVFKGASRFLDYYNGPIYCEFNTPKINNLGYTLKDLVSFIKEKGFNIYTYDGGEKKLNDIKYPDQYNGDAILVKE